ncbi:hypothetical protein BAE44_0008328 [Dichanthelium oligosanthes]|uniref:Uncharacterized protein n=1 Tax=Dichanthelium oligosanthes TaxID=888268 RepID=A0A1E5VZU7_9POAL|nr:hypothetical protein BAE44_0008328 [Dichanthelium oligosanthes]
MLLLHTVYMSMLRVTPVYLNLEFGYIAVAMSYVICLVFISGRFKCIFPTEVGEATACISGLAPGLDSKWWPPWLRTRPGWRRAVTGGCRCRGIGFRGGAGFGGVCEDPRAARVGRVRAWVGRMRVRICVRLWISVRAVGRNDLEARGS